jgi:hypothetical protein
MEEGYVFGRRGDSYIMLRAMSDGEGTLMFKNDMSGVSADNITEDMSKIKESVRALIEASGDLRYDLIFEGGTSHAWITELGSVDENESFDSFISEMLANNCEYENMKVRYTSGERAFDVKYSEHFIINGDKVDTNYARYENDYVSANIERKSEIISFAFDGKTLTLNYKEGLRVE